MPDEQALGKQSILNVADAHVEALDVPEWKGRVWLRVMTGKERDAFDALATATGVRPNIRACFAVRVIANEKGDRVFTDSDVEKLGEKSSLALDRIWDAGMKLNAILAPDVEELAGNSSGDRSDDSGSL